MTIAPPSIRLLEDGRGGTIRLALDDPALLFSAPAIRPLDGQHDDRSGIALILAAMKLSWPPKDGRLETLAIELPASCAQTMPEERVRDAIAAYCDHQVALAAIGVRLLGKERRMVWKIGGIFLLLFLGLSYMVGQLSFVPPMAQKLLQDSLVIAGWVGLWRPLELLLYGWWPDRYRLGLHNYLKRMPVRVAYV